MMYLLLLTILLSTISNVRNQNQGSDLTRIADRKGFEVVQAVISLIHDNCLFTDDRFFLKRLAAVQSNYGTDVKTYREGYNGGIWQINESKFNETRSCQGDLVTLCKTIRSNLKIDWASTTWEDLRKPLYSGLAATLYIRKKQTEIPPHLFNQSILWQNLFAPGQNLTRFTSIQEEKDACEQNIDLVFVIDTSGSISDEDFLKTIQFMVNVVDDLPIAQNRTRVGVLQFNDAPIYEFGLKAYNDKASLTYAIRHIVRGYGGTNTADALRMAYKQLFTTADEMRELSSKVLILVTDGASNSFSDTVIAANEVKKARIELFAIGVGGANLNELISVATVPICTHVFSLQDFNRMDTILNEIRRRACRAHVNVAVGDKDNANKIKIPILNVTKVIETKFEKDNITQGQDSNTTTLLTDATCSVVYIYASFLTTHPGSAFNEYTDIAVDGKPSILTIVDDTGRPLYVSYQAKKLNHNDSCYNASFSISSVRGKPSGAEVICRRNGQDTDCSRADLQLSKYNKYLCKDNSEYLKNPCTAYADISQASNLFHPVESDRRKFIRCDFMGNMYVTQCPDGDEFNPESNTCGARNLMEEDTGRTTLPSDLYNPCDHAPIKTGVRFFAHPTDKTKFIECDFTTHTWVMECPKNQVWRQSDQTCTVDYSYSITAKPDVTSTSVPNPCLTTKSGHYFPYPNDPSKYIRCDNGIMYALLCPAHTYFDAAKKVCGPQLIG